MVEKEIEQEYDVVETHTDTDTVVFCDGCTEETDDYVILSNASPECIDQIIDQVAVSSHRHTHHSGGNHVNVHDSPSTAVKKVLDERLEEFHLCRGCQRGIREHGRMIDTALYDAPEKEEDEDPPSLTLMLTTMIAVILSAVYWVGLMVAMISGSVAASSVLFASMALVLTVHAYRQL